MTDYSKPISPDRRLADIVREVKIAAADRTDVVVDMRDADRARLELLALDLKPVLDEIDAADDRFDFGISPGLQPRLWIDAVAHVHMGNDRRVFRFVRDTRLGRVVMSDTPDIAATADAVARYVAERVIERERILSGDFEAMRGPDNASAGLRSQSGPTGNASAGHDPESAGREEAGATTVAGTGAETATQPRQDISGAETSQPAAAFAAGGAAATTGQAPEKASRGSGLVLGASWFILGCVAGAAVLVVALWDRISALIG